MTSRSEAKVDFSATRIAGLTLVNAMVFQEVLAGYEARVKRLRQILQTADVVSQFAEHWNDIVTQINYHPIFYVAKELLLALPSNPDVDAQVKRLAETALGIVRERAALRHDLMGRVYHKLLADAKYLGTFYTAVPSATLLLKLALDRQRWKVDWGDWGELGAFRVADLACGTGTLLMAAAEAVTDNYLRACAEKRIAPKMDTLSKLLMEDMVWGYDVLMSALHLTASTLALQAPEVTFSLLHLYNMPHGGVAHRLGSIEFLKDYSVPIARDMFGGVGAADQVSGKGDVRERIATVPALDLCVMNPPFTRSVGGNLLFGSLPAAERSAMQKDLAKLLKSPRVHASGTAGLGSVFAATGDLHLKAGGRMALVLPKALLSGVAWQKTRHLFRLGYQLEYVIASHDPERWNFSENTNLSEVLVVARKYEKGERPAQDRNNVVCVNLWKNPRTSVEALGIANAVMRGEAPGVEDRQGALELRMGDVKYGEAISVPWAGMREGSWMPPCAFAQADLVRAASQLKGGRLFLPGHGTVGSFPVCPLSALGTLGPDRRDIHDGFNLVKGKTAYSAFWGHDASSMTTMAQKPNGYLSPLGKPKRGRPLRKVTDLWPKAGTLLVAERLRLNTQRLVAMCLEDKVLSNVWWPIALNDAEGETSKVLGLWLNSSLGILILLHSREETEGAWVDFKKPVLSAMPVLDPRALTSFQKEELVRAYDGLCHQELLPFPHMAHDPTRKAIDEAVASALGLPDLSVLRELLAQEPVVCLKPLA